MSKKDNVLSFEDMLAGRVEKANHRGSGFSATNAPNIEDADATADSEFVWADVDIVEDNPKQPRGAINADSDEQRDLVTQINQDGQEQAARARIHPTKPGYFQLIAGHRRKYSIKDGALFHDRPGAAPRRVRANAGVGQPKPDDFIGKMLLRLDRRPVTTTEPGMRRRAYQENRSRSDLKFIEDARFFRDTRDEMTAEARAEGKMTGDQEVSVRAIAKELGERDHTRIQRALAALTLPPPMVKALEEEKMNERNARGLLVLKDHPKAQRALFREVLKDSISGAATEVMAEARLKVLQEKTGSLTPPAQAASDTSQSDAPAASPLALVSDAGATKTRSTVAELPRLPQLVLDQLVSAATPLESACSGLALLEIVPQDMAGYEDRIKAIEVLVKRARREIEKHKKKGKSDQKATN